MSVNFSFFRNQAETSRRIVALRISFGFVNLCSGSNEPTKANRTFAFLSSPPLITRKWNLIGSIFSWLLAFQCFVDVVRARHTHKKNDWWWLWFQCHRIYNISSIAVNWVGKRKQIHELIGDPRLIRCQFKIIFSGLM